MGVKYNCFLSHYYFDLLTIYVKNKHKKKYTVNQNIEIVLKQLKELVTESFIRQKECRHCIFNTVFLFSGSNQ